MSADVQTVEPVELPKDLQDRAAIAVAAYEAVPIDTLVERVNLLKELMKRCMVEGQHHGLDHNRVEQKQFWPHVRRDPLTECWVWVGHRDRKGYGIFWLGGRRGKSVRVHRWSYQRFSGPIPEGLTIDHLCKNRACVNPDHLEPVTSTENTRRSNNLSVRNTAKTHCPKGHPYIGRNLLIDHKGKRRCRLCTNAIRRRYKSRLRAASYRSAHGELFQPSREEAQ